MQNNLEKLAKLIRYYILVSTTTAGSGHPSSSLSAADLMAVLMFGGFFKFDLTYPEYSNNDRLIFSKGHASPLFYSLWAVAGQPSFAKATEGESAQYQAGLKRAFDPQELMTLRKFGSRFEGHPTLEFPFTEVPTGSLGQGLSVGVGVALNAKVEARRGVPLPYRTYVLLGDSEMAEGSVWEAMACASFYRLDNLIAILDVNRLGQSRETMLGHDVETYQKRAEAFGWKTIVIDGHSIEEIQSAFEKATAPSPQSSPSRGEEGGGDKPKMIIAKTLKGKGVSFIENKEGWHGKALSREELERALEELGEVDKNIIGEVLKPATTPSASAATPPVPGGEWAQSPPKIGGVPSAAGGGGMKFTDYPKDKPVATRKAYGNALTNIFPAFSNMVVMDGETSNSTFSEIFRKAHPENYLEMFIAEQNMVSAALGLSRRGKIPFVSTFAAFFSRAFDQIRMSQYADSNIKFCGSHAGVSIGEDGSSQMGLEEIAMFRTLLGSVVLYPSDAVSTEKLVYEAAKHHGNVYIQTTRKDTAILYSSSDEFPIGGSKTLKSSDNDVATVVGAGITLHEALAAYEELKKENINIRVIDLYSIKPIDLSTLQKAAAETKSIITVEDNFAEGGIGEAVATTLSQIPNSKFQISNLAVTKMPRSGKPAELLEYEEIDKVAIVKKVKELINARI